MKFGLSAGLWALRRKGEGGFGRWRVRRVGVWGNWRRRRGRIVGSVRVVLCESWWWKLGMEVEVVVVLVVLRDIIQVSDIS